jgi:hypothetical protein
MSERLIYLSVFILFGSCWPLNNYSQTNDKKGGIHFVTGESWNDIKRIARENNKYIFVDVYAT